MERAGRQTRNQGRVSGFQILEWNAAPYRSRHQAPRSLYLIRGEDHLREHDPGGLEPIPATLDEFQSVLREQNHTLKRALADPHLFSGIGNAYSDEILHRARLSPLALSQKLTSDEVERLYSATRAVLLEWIERLRAETGDGWPEKVTAFRPGHGGAWPVWQAVSRLWCAGAANPLCRQRDQLLPGLSDERPDPG